VSLPATGMTLAERREDLLRRYQAAAEDAARLVAGSASGQRTDDPEGVDLPIAMRAAVDAIWTHLAPTGVSWVGFYLPVPTADQADGASIELVLGPSRDKPACSPIGLHGVCGQGFTGRTTRIVADVADLGENYVACDPRDRSEIVLPVFRPRSIQCIAVLDLDSHEVGRFSALDAEGLAGVLAAVGLRTA
jgi:putative methionine-R-sulfoxide reductase with GAF domain